MPTSPDAWRMLGFSQYACQLFTDSVTSMGRAVGLQPENPENNFGLGMANAATGDFDSAISSFDETVRLRPDHPHAKKGLVDALLRRAQVYLSQNNGQYAEHDMDRAVKIDRRNPEPVLVLAKYFVDTGQQARAGKLAQQALLDMPNDSTIKAAAHQLGVSAPTSAVTEAQKKAQVQQSQEGSCPACKKTVMNWASVCPHCSTVIRQIPSQFAGRDTGPRYSWKEVAYKIMAVLWILNGVFSIFQGFMLTQGEQVFRGIEMYSYVVGAIIIGMGIGLLLETEWVQFVAKIVCILYMMGACYYLLVGFGIGKPVYIGIGSFQLLLGGFQVYFLSEIGE